MKVKELISQLQELDPNLPVFVTDPHVQVSDACFGAGEQQFSLSNWEGGGIVDDLKDGDIFVEIYS